MALIISNNLVVTQQPDMGQSGLIGYQNILNVNNVTASSALDTNPITNVANPATAYTWESAIADYAGSISYEGANVSPSPSDPSGWYGATTDPDGTISNTALQNPSGEFFVGLVEQSTASSFLLTRTIGSTLSVQDGDKIYSCMLVKNININTEIEFYFDFALSSDDRARVVAATGENTWAGSGVSVRYTKLTNGFNLIECEKVVTANDTVNDIRTVFLDADGEIPAIGSQCYVQSSFAGLSTDYPAIIDPAGIKIDVNTSGQSVDYVGLARHNLNQTGLTVSLKFDGITILQNETVSDIQAIMLLVNEAAPDNVQIIINGATNAPQIGVIYVGKALQLERNIYVGHTPITYGRNRKTVNGVSENGQYLGEIVVRQTNMTSVNLQNLTPDWYRSFLDPFFKLTPRVPCFWAWRPQGYPDEVGYCWIEGEPSMSNQRSNGMVEASWQFKGIA